MNTYLLISMALLFVGYLTYEWIGLRHPHKPSLSESIKETLFWIVSAIIFGGLVYYTQDAKSAIDFFSVYMTEKMLSLDNLFVILLIFNFFNIEDKYQKKALMYGIIGAIVLRAIFIGAGTIIVAKFAWILYVFGAFLVWTGIALLREHDEKDHDMDKNWMLRGFKKIFPVSTSYHGGKFFLKENGKTMVSVLFMCVLMIEATDLIFAVDSIPASFAITTDPYIIYTANLFAIMGLRALFFVIEYILEKFHLLNKALAIILLFIGGKMFLGPLGLHISSGMSFAILISILASGMILSQYVPKRNKGHL